MCVCVCVCGEREREREMFVCLFECSISDSAGLGGGGGEGGGSENVTCKKLPAMVNTRCGVPSLDSSGGGITKIGAQGYFHLHGN